MSKHSLTRRDFINLSAGALAAASTTKILLQPQKLFASGRPIPPSDTVRFASIGTGVRGCELLKASLRVPGVECVGVCDLYEGRHTAARESVDWSIRSK